MYVGSLDGGEPKRILPEGTRAIYAAPGYLLFTHERLLMAQRFDPERLTLSGEPAAVGEGVLADPFSRAGAFSASDIGTLLYRTRQLVDSELAWFDRSGRPMATTGERGIHTSFDLLRDGARVVVTREDPRTGNRNLWVADTARDVMTRVTLGAFNDVDPRWSPDGREILFGSTRSPNRTPFKVGVSGGRETALMTSWPGQIFSLDNWSRDGRFILYHDAYAPEIWAKPFDENGKPQSVVRTLTGTVDQARFSPDMRWIAYDANETGRYEVYIVPFPPTGQKWQVSTQGGVQPMWRGDGRELFYLNLDGVMTAVDVEAAGTLSIGTSRPLFRTPLSSISFQTEQYAVTRDGQRFLVVTPARHPGEKPRRGATPGHRTDRRNDVVRIHHIPQ